MSDPLPPERRTFEIFTDETASTPPASSGSPPITTDSGEAKNPYIPDAAEHPSVIDTLGHCVTVQEGLSIVIKNLAHRTAVHDASKFLEPELSAFDKAKVKLATCEYGSDEYKVSLLSLGPALDHHYANNSHHPEHFGNGINGMTLLDLIEMFVDWKAASMRHQGGSLAKSIQINHERFKMTDQLTEIFENTRKELGWE